MPTPDPNHSPIIPSDSHFNTVISSIIDGRVVPFFGAGVNLSERPSGAKWKDAPKNFLPSGRELASHLAELFLIDEEVQDELKLRDDLTLTSQYVDTMSGQGPLYQKLHEVFDEDRPPTWLHNFFARLPRVLREKGYPKSSDDLRQRLIIITTNYDDLIERAFKLIEEPFHVISYKAGISARSIIGEEGEYTSQFLHWPPEGEPRPILKPNEYQELSHDSHPVIIKIHGAIDRIPRPPYPKFYSPFDSFVITEDHYIDYLLLRDITKLLPMSIVGQLNYSNFLFLGYKLRDWNLRAILRRIWLSQKESKFNSWAVMLDCTEFDEKYWAPFELEVLKADLKDYIHKLNERLMQVLETK